MRIFTKLATIGAAAALLAPIALVAAAPAAMATTGCRTGALPVTVVGSPAMKAHQALGVYLWHNGSGYSLRATHPGKARVTITGSVTVSRRIHAVKRVALERHDAVRVGPHRRTIAFKFNNYGYIDGFDFATDCSRTLKVVVKIGAAQATPAQVFLGKNRTNPTSVPFTIERTVASRPANPTASKPASEPSIPPALQPANG